MSDFVHLHVHSEYSLLDGALRIESACGRARELGMGSMALTDHGNMHGYIRFYNAANAVGLHPILGCELYMAPRRMKDRIPDIDAANYHITFLAADNTGFKNLVQMVSLANLEGFYYKPRIDKALLSEKYKGIICMSGCLGGEIPTLIMNRKFDQAREVAQWFQNLFGDGSYYLELMDNGMPKQREVNEVLVQLSRELSIPLVATNDIHYLNASDSEAQDALLCIQTGSILQDAKRMRMETEQFYFKTQEEMAALFPDFPQALSITADIAGRCDVKLEFGKTLFPAFEIPGGKDADDYLKDLCEQALPKRYGADPGPEILQRLDHELAVIRQVGYAGYFLIVSDFIDYARSKDIWVGPGRGSAAGSIVSYLLGITNLDPLKYNLIFERFLNPERVSPPDIDIDFCQERRGEVIDYVIRKYGSDKVAQIVTFGTMKTRQVVRDVGRVLGMPYSEVDAVVKLIPEVFPGGKLTITSAIESSPELFDMVRDKEQIKHLMDIAEKLEGLARHCSVHAAGVVIANEPLMTITPVHRSEETGGMVTQITMTEIEKIGLLKMDFLGLRTLTVIRDTLAIIKKVYGVEIDIDKIPEDDQKTFELFGRGETDGIFQFESDGMKGLMRDVKPTSIEDLIALNALYRPGPMDLIPQYKARKNGQEQAAYLHPLMEPILKETYGIMIYQEQVMQIAMALAGFSAGAADSMRRAMGKKKSEEMQKLRSEFVEGCKQRGIAHKAAGQIFDHVEKFAGYGFNKSHSAAYGLLAYQTMYLKAHYPLAYMAAETNSHLGAMASVTKAINSCRRMGIRILPPDVNLCGARFTVVGDAIRFGLAAVKNVGVGAIEAIAAERDKNGEFGDIFDLCSRVDMKHLNRKVLESLIKSGACDSLKGHRAQMLAAMDPAMELGAQVQRDRDSGQISLFGDQDPAFAGVVGQPPLPMVEEFDGDQILKFEKELLGFYVSRHPLDSFRDWISQRVDCDIATLSNRAPGHNIVIGGIITSIRRNPTRNGKMMAYATLEDYSGSVDLVIFPQVLNDFGPLLSEDSILLVRGRLDLKERWNSSGDEELVEPSIVVDKIAAADPNLNEIPEFPTRKPSLHIRLSVKENPEQDMLRLRDLIETHAGKCGVILHLVRDEKESRLELGNRFLVDPEDAFVEELRGIYNVSEVWKEQANGHKDGNA